MSTIDHTADLRAIDEAISTMDFQVQADAQRCARDNDLAGLVFIANMAMGRPGGTAMRLSLAIDLANYLRGIAPSLARPRGPHEPIKP